MTEFIGCDVGLKTVYLPLRLPARLVTVPGSARIRIEMEGVEPLGYDPPDRRLFVFGDRERRPVRPPLSEFQTRALLRHLDRHNLDRMAACRATHLLRPADAGSSAPQTDARKHGDAGGRGDDADDRSRRGGNVIDIRSRPGREGGRAP